MMGDANGDGLADIVGFFADGVHVSLSTGNIFQTSTLWIQDFFYVDPIRWFEN